MTDEFEKYTRKLIRDRSAVPESIRLYRLDDTLIASREDEWLPVFSEVFRGLNIAALLFAQPSLPFADFLIARTSPDADRLLPKDSETRLFLHDIPFIRRKEWEGRDQKGIAEMLISGLRKRKAVLLEGAGIAASGGLTVEQAYIGFSSVFHATFVKYLLDLLYEGIRLPAEEAVLRGFRDRWQRPVDVAGLEFEWNLTEREIIIQELCRVGRYTVEKGLVDSFFGNISVFDGRTIFISETASSLDELEGHIVPVAMDGSSTAGLSASSELPVHRAVYLSTSCRAVLHGHPKFSVVMSMYCTEECDIEDCTRDCNRKRYACGVPIVTGETGAGGLAKTVPTAVKESGACIAYGHGVFSLGKSSLREAFVKMVDIENRCRQEYFELIR